jgi:hypothetical protein
MVNIYDYNLILRIKNNDEGKFLILRFHVKVYGFEFHVQH